MHPVAKSIDIAGVLVEWAGTLLKTYLG